MAKRGAYSSLSAKGKKKFAKVMHEFSKGTLRSGGKGKVTDRDQAIAIAFSEARRYG